MNRYNSLYAIIIAITAVFSPCGGMDNFDSWATKSILFQGEDEAEQQTQNPPVLLDQMLKATMGKSLTPINKDPIFKAISLIDRYQKASDESQKNDRLADLTKLLIPSLQEGLIPLFSEILKENTQNEFKLIASDIVNFQNYPNQEAGTNAVENLKKDINSNFFLGIDADSLTEKASSIKSALKKESVSSSMLAAYKTYLSSLLPALKNYVYDEQKNMIDVLLEQQKDSTFKATEMSIFLDFICGFTIEKQINFIVTSNLSNKEKLSRLKELFDLYQKTDPRKIFSRPMHQKSSIISKDNLKLWLQNRDAIKAAYEKLLNQEKIARQKKEFSLRLNTQRALFKKGTYASADWLKNQELLLKEYIDFLEKNDAEDKKLPRYKKELANIQLSIKTRETTLEQTNLIRNLPENASIDDLKNYKSYLEKQEGIKPNSKRAETINLLERQISKKVVAKAQKNLEETRTKADDIQSLATKKEQNIITQQQQKEQLVQEQKTLEQEITDLNNLNDLKRQEQAITAKLVDQLTEEFKNLPNINVKPHEENVVTANHFDRIISYRDALEKLHKKYPEDQEINQLLEKTNLKFSSEAAEAILFIVDKEYPTVLIKRYFNLDPKYATECLSIVENMKKLIDSESKDLCNINRYQDLPSTESLASLLALREKLKKLGQDEQNKSFAEFTTQYTNSLREWFINGMTKNLRTVEDFPIFLGLICEHIQILEKRILAATPAQKAISVAPPTPQQEIEFAVSQKRPIPLEQAEEPQIPKPLVINQKQTNMPNPDNPIRPANKLLSQEENQDKPIPSGLSYWLSTQPIWDFFSWIRSNRFNPLNWL